MTWQAVAEKDFKDAVRSYWLWGLSVLFVVFFTVPAYFFADRIGAAARRQGASLTSDSFLSLLAEVNAFFVPVIAIVVAYASIAGERDSGTLKLLLSLPHSRLDVVAGKVVGRGGVVVLPILAGFLVAGVVFLATPVEFAVGNYFLFALLTALLGVAFASLAVGVSAASETGRQAMIGTVGVYVLFTLFWNRFASGLVSILSDHTGLRGEALVPLHLFVRILNPTQAYKSLTVSLTQPATTRIGQGRTVSGEMIARVQLVGGSGLQGQLTRQTYLQTLGDSLPFYLADPFLLLLLLAWLVGAPLVGYAAFREMDL